ncbi:alpha/beta fold hydrolase [Pseudoduganella lutea]|uniref:Alpha/beta hydrolase n=1 Tax=Pseudoduganella lutea TaxID=321985 RepID=A0A4P6KS23_9BURK|nr:alpha/beta hydrolase [Pseudoduganella lutea]QBE61899.1 alpha/beta hydrolase [Pseudoduganella lutea]
MLPDFQSFARLHAGVATPVLHTRRRLLGAAALLGLGVQPRAIADEPERPSRFPLQRHSLSINGQPFHVLEQGTGPAVLFCHGFPDTAETWRKQMSAMAEAGYRAVAPDMRGFGKSHAPAAASLYSSRHIVADLVGILDALKIPSAAIVGHDWGADHAQRAALMHPERFRALVSISIPYAPRGEIDTWESLRRRGLGQRYYALDWLKPGSEAAFTPAAASIRSILYWASSSPPPDRRWDPVDPSRSLLRPAPASLPAWADPGYVRHTIRSFEESGFRGGLNYYRALPVSFAETAAFKDAPIRQPSLYVWGADDGLCRFFHPDTPQLAELRRMQPRLVDQVRLDGVGHWVQHEAPDRLNAALLQFLAGLGAS